MCCFLCSNILNIDKSRLEGQTALKHYSEALPPDFELRTDATIWRDVDYLAAQRPRMPEARFKELSQEIGAWAADGRRAQQAPDLAFACFPSLIPPRTSQANVRSGDFAALFCCRRPSEGLNLNPHGLLADTGLRRFFKPVGSTSFDWMHCLVASGGVYQYLCNFAVRDLLAQGHTLANIDSFGAQIRIGGEKVDAELLKNAYNKESGSHLKGFASTTLQAIEVIFCYLGAHGGQADFRNLFKVFLLAKQSLLVLCDTTRPVDEIANRLDGPLQEIFVLLAELFNFSRPKSHFSLHLPQNFKTVRIVCSCFSNERRNRIVKAAADKFSGQRRRASCATKLMTANCLRWYAETSIRARCIRGATYPTDRFDDSKGFASADPLLKNRGPRNFRMRRRGVQSVVVCTLYFLYVVFSSVPVLSCVRLRTQCAFVRRRERERVRERERERERESETESWGRNKHLASLAYK